MVAMTRITHYGSVLSGGALARPVFGIGGEIGLALRARRAAADAGGSDGLAGGSADSVPVGGVATEQVAKPG